MYAYFFKDKNNNKKTDTMQLLFSPIDTGLTAKSEMSVYTCSTNNSSLMLRKVAHGKISKAALTWEAKGALVSFDTWLISLSTQRHVFASSSQNKVVCSLYYQSATTKLKSQAKEYSTVLTTPRVHDW